MDTSAGPDHGNLACVWAVDKIFTLAFGRRLTSSLSTSVIDDELRHSTCGATLEVQARPGSLRSLRLTIHAGESQSQVSVQLTNR
jgi:hypothetical protein